MGEAGGAGSLRVSVPAELPASHLPNDSHLNTGCGQVAPKVWLSVVGEAQKQALGGKSVAVTWHGVAVMKRHP